MVISPPEPEERLFQVAPSTLENFRVNRYRGDDISIHIAEFSEKDRAGARRLYAILQQLFADLSHRETPDGLARVAAFLRGAQRDQLSAMAQELGRETCAANWSCDVAKAVHDLRGGGLTPLLGLLELAARRGVDEETANLLFYLSRDHLKIMRNILLGLDDARREQDLQPNAHGTDLIVEKWHDTVLHENGRHVRLVVDCQESATIGACCMEFGAVDRILYNLINNACRHTDDELMRLLIFPVPDEHGESLRFVLLNHLSPDDRRQLAKVDLGDLFQEGVSSTGSGFGLSIVSEFVSHAYGLPNNGDAVHRRYVGAVLVADCFAAWFHWPRVLRR